MKRLLVIAFALSILTANSAAQTPPAWGQPPFSSIHNNGFDQVNVGNLDLTFALPILHMNGRGLPLSFSVTYNSLAW